MLEDAIGLLSMQLSLMPNQNLTSLVLCDVRSSDLKITETGAKYLIIIIIIVFAISNYSAPQICPL